MPGSNGYPNIKKFVQEAYCVMKPGGVLIINTVSPDQCQPNVLWYYSLVPNVHKHLSQRYTFIYIIIMSIYNDYAWGMVRKLVRGGGGGEGGKI